MNYSILTVNELEPSVLESSVRISKFYAPTDSEHKFNKMEIKKLATHRIQFEIVLIGNPQS